AQGYVAKNDNPYLLLEAVQKVSAGGLYLMPQMADAFLLNATRQNADPWLQLNSRERDILRLIGEGFDLKEIAERTDVTYKTIANSCTLIKKKLGLRSSSDLSRKAVEYKNMI
ncbi:MAG: response regulator transcription factor, partial [Methylocystis sp.]